MQGMIPRHLYEHVCQIADEYKARIEELEKELEELKKKKPAGRPPKRILTAEDLED